MATINTIEDLIRVLDENPAWLEAMRSRLLTRELLELPERFSQLTDRVDQLAIRMDQLTDRVDQLTNTVNQYIEASNKRFDAIEVRLDNLETDVKVIRADMTEVKSTLAHNVKETADLRSETNEMRSILEQNVKETADLRSETNEMRSILEHNVKETADLRSETNEMRSILEHNVKETAELRHTVNNHSQDIREMKDAITENSDKISGMQSVIRRHSREIGELKGILARNAVIDAAALVAREMGLRRIRNLIREDLWDMTDSSNTSDISTNDIRSFRRADLVIEATDSQQQICYVAVEISYTADERDTNRAIRNANFIARFTGKPAHAAVAGLQMDNRIQNVIDDGQVFWHQLDAELLSPE